jgi:hypothetical protein
MAALSVIGLAVGQHQRRHLGQRVQRAQALARRFRGQQVAARLPVRTGSPYQRELGLDDGRAPSRVGRAGRRASSKVGGWLVGGDKATARCRP